MHDEAGKKVPNRGWVSIGNYGKTPAILKKVEWGFCDKTAINLDAPISELFEKKMLPHYEILTRVDVIRHGIPPYAIDGTEFTLADKSGKIFFGKFSYDILFDDKERFSTFKLEITKDGGSVGLPGSYSDWS